MKNSMILIIIIFCTAIQLKAADTAPVYDRYGQKTSMNWKGKITSDEQLKADSEADRKYYKSLPLPENLDEYGGLAGSGEKLNLKPTGYFYITKVSGRYILVTPKGNAFFAITTGGLMSWHSFVAHKGKEDKFEWLPSEKGKFRKAYKYKQVSFYVANLIRKNGSYDYGKWRTMFAERLKRWGFNSFSSYGNCPSNAKNDKIPVTLVIQCIRSPKKHQQLSSGFFDAYNPKTCAEIENALKKEIAGNANNPWIIGYMVQNEPDFSYLVFDIAKADEKTAAKHALVKMLKEKYKTVEAFNTAWNMSVKNFNEVLKPLAPLTDQANKDMREFMRIFLDHYYHTVTAMIKKNDPNHLILGSRCRVRDACDELVNQCAGKYCDAVSVNYYCYAFNTDIPRRAFKESGRPVILTEWCYDVSDQGLVQVLRTVEDQKTRGLAYRNYVENAAALPFVIGVQWWCMLDNQNFGTNTGLVNVADQPYKEFLEGVTETNRKIYDIMFGKCKPFKLNHPNFTSSGKSRCLIAEVPRALPGMKVDGHQAPWPDRPATQIARTVQGKQGEYEFSANYWLCYDDKNLYVYIDVLDKTPRINPKKKCKRGIWGGDAVEIFCGKNTDKDGRRLASDRHLLINAETGKHWFWERSPKQYKVQIAMQDAHGGGGYIMEIGIPMKAFGIDSVKPGMEMRFDIGVDDSENPKASRIRQIMWNGTSDNSSLRDKWGIIRFTE